MSNAIWCSKQKIISNYINTSNFHHQSFFSSKLIFQTEYYNTQYDVTNKQIFITIPVTFTINHISTARVRWWNNDVHIVIKWQWKPAVYETIRALSSFFLSLIFSSISDCNLIHALCKSSHRHKESVCMVLTFCIEINSLCSCMLL